MNEYPDDDKEITIEELNAWLQEYYIYLHQSRPELTIESVSYFPYKRIVVSQ